MVDIIANDVMVTSINPDFLSYVFKDKVGKSRIFLWALLITSLSTEDPTIIATYGNWIK